MNFRNLYRFTDIFWKNEKLSSKWKRILVSEIDHELRNKQKGFNVFNTIQFFKHAVPETDELHYCPIYFDLDSENDVSLALEDTKKLCSYFYAMGIGREHVRVWFSGKKGFHITVTPELFNIQPHKELTYVIKWCCLFISEQIKMMTLDPQVYTARRMWRLPDSVHHTTRLYAIELLPHELDMGMDWIREKAKAPRGKLYDDIEYENVSKIEHLSDWFLTFVKEYEDSKDLERLKPKKLISKPANLSDDDPVCVKHVLTQGLSKPNTRNKAEMVLSAYYKDTGKPIEYASKILEEWVLSLPRGDKSTSDRDRIADAKAVTRAVYNKDGPAYHFSCSYIRSLGAESEKPIPCLYENCPFVKQEDQESDGPIELELHEASRACYVGKPIKFQVTISGKDMAPYIIPERVKVRCEPKLEEGSPCMNCKISPFGGSYEYSFNVKQRHFIELLDAPSNKLHGVVKDALKIPKKCPGYSVDIIDNQNVVDVQLMPRVHLSKENLTREMEYVVRRGFNVGHDIAANKDYEITGFIHPDPKTQYAVHAFNDVKELKSRINDFNMTEGLYEDLKVFQINENQSVGDKLDEIHHDLEHNVTRIWERKDVAIAIDLVYHSVLGFTFNDSFVKRGWMNLLIIGDTGQGKTKQTEELMRHYELGTIVGGETSRRTGLLYNIQETQKRWFLTWGTIPLNDRGLVVIDEFTGISEEDFAQMTRMRESGILEVNAVRSAVTTARTRLIFLSNTRDGKMLSEYQFGIEAVENLLKNKEDIRRFDLAVTVAVGEVDGKSINVLVTPSFVNHTYTSERCRSLILWAWSRQPEYIIFEKDATIAILETANFFSDNYVSSPPLVVDADMRIKIARMSVAVAARVFSTDEKGESVIVKKEHVEYIKNFLDTLYAKPSMGYKILSSNVIRSRNKALESHEIIINHIKDLPDYKELVNTLVMMKTFRISELADMWGNEVSAVKELLRYFNQYRMVSSTPQGYKKTENLVAVLRKMHNEITAENKEYDDEKIPF